MNYAVRPIILLSLLIAGVSLLNAQSQFVLRPSLPQRTFQGLKLQHARTPGRPKIGLVLSGGGGRGLAQIGVLRALERNNIPIDLIVGNSLGAVLGGLYAAGYSTTEIESIATHTNWNELLSFSEETKRTDLFIGQKELQQEGFLVIRFDGLAPVIPSSISGGQRLSNYFSYLALQALYHPNPSFDDLKIPFRAVATDLISGRRVVLDQGSLSEAMRASVTVPLLYTPLEKDSMFLVDGGLASNIPVDVARNLGCDIVIAVNSTSSMRTAEQMSAPWEIADQIMTIMMQESNQHQLALADVVITPPTKERIVSDFTGIDSLITTGEAAGEEGIPKIRDMIQRREQIVSTSATDSLHQAIVEFNGDSISADIRFGIEQEVKKQTLTTIRIEQSLDMIYASGRYREAYAEVTRIPAVVRYHAVLNAPLNNIRFDGNQYVPDSIINRALSPCHGTEIYISDIQKGLENVLSAYRRFGYSLARIESLTVDQKLGSLTFHINEGRIAQMRYEGNDRTRDYIIRREFPLDEGDVFTIDKATRGITNIRSTGLFEYVLLDVRYVRNKAELVIKVKEKSSELVRLGFHADDEHGVVSTLDIRNANFRGAWEDLGFVLQYGFRDRGAQLGYTVNRIFNTYLTFNLRTYTRSRDIVAYGDDRTVGAEHWDRVEIGRYREAHYGAAFNFGAHYERLGDVTAELVWENQHIRELTGGGYVPEQYRYAALRMQSIIDTKDRFSFPTRGIALSLTYESALKGLGSEVAFGKFSAEYELYASVGRHTLHPRLVFGFADRTLPLAEQFSLGGFGSFYGLREDDSRGRQIFLLNTEYRFHFPFRVLFETYLGARYDLGMISSVPEELKLNSFRHGIGMDISLDTPLGQASFGAGASFYFRKELPNSPAALGPLLLYFSIGPRL